MTISDKGAPRNETPMSDERLREIEHAVHRMIGLTPTQEIDLLAEVSRLRAELEEPAPDDYRCRMWALTNVRRAEDSKCDTHGKEFQDGCVKCAYQLGRILGQVEAGAYQTSEEALGPLRKAFGSPAPTVPTNG